MRVLFLQHDHVSPPGPIADRFAARGFEVVESVVVPRDRFFSPDVDFDFPEIHEHDVVVPMGAPWGAWDDDRIGTWLKPELDWLRDLQKHDVPIFAICFGAQALARALGGAVAPGPRAEIGYTWINSDDVDLVPLAEAWGSGASTWTTARRQAYANDLGDYRTLVGVTDSVNQSKSDQDPATWLPTYDKCRYVAEWVAVKIRWGLSADSAEKSVLNSYASSCSNTITVTTA